MSRAVKSIGRAVGKVVSGIGRAVKRVVKSPLGKIAIGVGALYFGLPAFQNMVGSFGSAVSGGVGSLMQAGKGLIGGLMGTAAPAAADIAAMGNVGMGAATNAAAAGSGGGLIGSVMGGVKALGDWVATPGGGALTKMAIGLLTPNETAMRINAQDQWQKEAVARANANQNVGAIRLPGVYAAPQEMTKLPTPAGQPVVASKMPGRTDWPAPLPGMPLQPVAPDPNLPQDRPWQTPGLISGAMA
jgi:hypothetical protein